MLKYSSLLLITAAMLSPFSVSACPDALKFVKRKLNSQETVNLCQAYQDKAVLIVNTASFCGFTPQFKGLEALYNEYKDDGLVVLGFPSASFDQEADSEEKTAEVCELTYGVKFPMFETLSVKGDDADPMFRILARDTGKYPSWNFNKYLISKDGKTVTHYGSRTSPNDANLVNDIKQILAL